MTRLAAQQLIEARLGQRTGLASRIVTELQVAQKHFERKAFLPWFLRTVQPSTTYLFSMPVPTGFLRELDDEAFVVRLEETKSVPLIRESYEVLIQNPDMFGTGLPMFYCPMSDAGSSYEQFELFPRPDAVYDLRLTYYKADDVLTDDSSENRWLYYSPDLLVAQAGLQMAKALRSLEATQVFASDLLEATKDLFTSHVARDMSARSMTMGG